MISKILCSCEIKISEVSALYASFVEAGFQFCTEHVCLLIAKPTVVYKKLEKGCYGTLFHAGFSRPYATGKASVAQQLGVKISVRHLFLSSFFQKSPNSGHPRGTSIRRSESGKYGLMGDNGRNTMAVGSKVRVCSGKKAGCQIAHFLEGEDLSHGNSHLPGKCKR